jgi:hypothetical protein
VVAIGEGIVKSPEDHDAAPISADGTLSVRIKRAAVAVRG